MKMASSSLNELKTMWEKEKMLITSNFSSSRSVFKRLVRQTRKNQGLLGKELKYICQDRKAFTIDKSKVGLMMYVSFNPVQSTVENGKNVGNQHFLQHPTVFLKGKILGILW